MTNVVAFMGPAAWLIASRFLLVSLATVVVYRAATQSIVYDEAFTYLNFVSVSLREVFTAYNANNHVLYSLLAHFCVRLFGPSELALRLPTLVAAGFYFWALVALCRSMFGPGHLSFLTLATLSLNPFILDQLSVGRGYGTALALYVFALQQLTQSVVGRPSVFDRRWLIGSLALAFSVCANLTFLFPSLALGCIVISMDVRRRQQDGEFHVSSYARAAVLWFAIPGVLAAAALLAVPLSEATSEHFLYGAASVSRSMQSLLGASLLHNRDPWPAGPERLPADAASRFLGWVVVVPVLLGICVSMALAVRRRRQQRVDQLLLLTGGTLALTVFGLVAAHRLFDLPYPFGRTGLYLVILFALASSTLVRKLQQSTGRFAKAAAAVLLVLLVLQLGRFATEFNTTYYYDWRFDSGTRTIFGIIRDWPRSPADGPARVAASRSLFGQSLEFYRVVHGRARILPIVDDWQASGFDYDFFVVSPGAHLEYAQRLADVVYIHPDSRAALLVNRNRIAAPAVR